MFPLWLYHKSEDPKLIQTQEEFDALGEGWEESPAAFGKESHPAQKVSKEAQAEAPKEESAPKAIESQDLTKKSIAELSAMLVEAGVLKESLKGLKKDELIAKLGAI